MVAPAEPYLHAAKYALEQYLVPLADVALGRTAACILEQDIPKARGGGWGAV